MAVGYAVTLLGDFHLAEDAAQEAFLAAHRQIGDLREELAFPGWFRMIVRTACNRMTRKKRWVSVSLDPDDVMVDSGRQFQEGEDEMSESILSAVWALPEAERSVIALSYVSNYTHQEIADFLNVPASTVQGRLRTGRDRLKDRMLAMAKRELNEHAPSRDSLFGDRVKRLVRPDQLKSDDEALWSGGKGNDVWEMIKSAIEGDLKQVEKLVKKDERLVNCSFQYRQPLHFAVQENHIDVVRFLLSRGADATHRSGNPWHVSPVTIAEERDYEELAHLLRDHLKKAHGATEVKEHVADTIRFRDFSRIKDLFGDDPLLIDAVDGRGNKPIHWASLTRQMNVIDLLLDNGADINAMRPDGARPLDLTNGDYWYRGNRDIPKSAVVAHEVVVGFLVARGADYDISVAANVGDTERVREILDVDPESANRVPHYSTYSSGLPLRNAARGGHVETIKLLLDRGADPSTPEPGIAPRGGALHNAAKRGSMTIARLLLERGADPNADVESSGNCVTIAGNNTEMVKLLVSYGGQFPEWKDLSDVPAESLEAVYGEALPLRYYVDVEDLEMLEKRFDEDPEFVREVLHLALRSPFGMKKKVVRLCLDRDPDTAKTVHAFDLIYMLHRVPEKELLEPFRWLLESGMTPNDSNWMRVTALHRLVLGKTSHGTDGSVYTPLPETTQLFIEFGADLNARDEEFASTPLGWAARWGRKEMVELLLERGAKVEPPDDPEWAKPVVWAAKKGHTEIVNLLKGG